MRFFKTVIIIAAIGVIGDGGTAAVEEIKETFKVFRIFPRDWRDVENIATLQGMSEDNEVDFWLASRQPGQFAEVMVSPKSQAAVRNWLQERNLRFRVTINDVEKLIHQQESSFKPSKKKSMENSTEASGTIDDDDLLQQVQRLRDSPLRDDSSLYGQRSFEEIYKLKGYNYPFGEYTSYPTMLRYMRTIEFYYPHLAKLIRIGTTHEGRPIEGLKLGYHVSNSTKRVFWIDGNIHAREWTSSHTALFIINQLVGGYGKDPAITHYMNHLNFLIVPNVNPDGYEYSRSSSSPEIRLWRKNRSPEKCVASKWGGLRCCQGVDLNRNFDFHWAESGASDNPCSSIYAGEGPTSEPETMAISKYLMSDEYRYKVDGFITIHSYGQLFIHPYSHEVEYYPNDVRKLEKVAQKAVDRLRSVYGTQYRIGTGADLLAPAAGGSDDWAKESLYSKYVYLIELRPQLELTRGFILNQDELIPTAIETFEGIKAVIEAVLEENGIIPKPLRRNKVASNTGRVYAVPTVSETKSSLLTNEKFSNGRFRAPENNGDLSPFRTSLETIQQGNEFISKATLTVHETTTERPTTIIRSTTTRRPTTTTESTTMPTTTPSTTSERTTMKTTTTSPETTQPSTTPPTTTTQKSETITTTESTTVTTSKSTTDATTTESLLTSPIASKSLEDLTSRPSPDTMAKRLTQELLRKQLLRLQALKTMKEAIRERLVSSTAPSVTIYQAPRFLTVKPQASETSTVSSGTTAAMQLPPLVVGKPKSSSNPLQYQPTSTCSDKKYSCTFWIKADKHVCDDQQRFMRLNCQRSCKFCN